jgi:very-short-patch-repair endonuclease
MVFKKGQKAWNKGKKGRDSHWFGKTHTKETKEKLRKLGTNRLHSQETKEKMRLKDTGRKESEKHKRKISESLKLAYKEGRKKMPKNFSHKGYKHSEETKLKLKLATIKYIKEVCNYLHPMIGHNEKQILDKLEQELNYKILRQYEVEGYFIDGYIEELNLAIEVDEKPKNKERDIERQKIIENKLNCKFMRIKDYD